MESSKSANSATPLRTTKPPLLLSNSLLLQYNNHLIYYLNWRLINFLKYSSTQQTIGKSDDPSISAGLGNHGLFALVSRDDF